jgi:hypothetical protein
MQFQAVDSGFAARGTYSRQPAESPSTLREATQETKNPEVQQGRDFAGRGFQDLDLAAEFSVCWRLSRKGLSLVRRSVLR